MKPINWNKIGLSLGISSVMTLALVLASGCVVRVRPYGGAVVTTPPPPAVTVDVGVPDDYAWDGYEYVGLVGGVYFYLGPGNVWLRCEPWRLDRFHGWERDHPDWHAHAIRNDRYRNDSHGHYQPRHDRRDEGGH
jgi:hypothetical protein